MDSIKKFLDRIEIYVIIVIFSLLLLLMFVQVIARYVFGIAFGWGEQMSRLMFVYITFAGMSYAARASAHLKVSFVAEFFPSKKVGQIIYLIGDLICSGIVLFLAFMVFRLTVKVAAEGQTFAAAKFCPVWVMYAGGFLGLLGMGLRTLQFGAIPQFKKVLGMGKEKEGIS